MDIALLQQQAGEAIYFDLALSGFDLVADDGLLTAVIISLFTDRRANDDDPLPDERIGVLSDLRGWWGDCILEEDRRDPLGSRLWLLSREKEVDVVVARAQQYADEALEWLIRDGHVGALHVVASHAGPACLIIDVQALPVPGRDDKTREWNFVYDYINAAPVSIKAPGL